MTTDATAKAPTPLRFAALVVVIEALVLAGYGVVLVFALTDQRVAMGVTSSGFLVVYGAFLVFCAARLVRLESWVRAPIVMAQLIQGLVGFSFWGGTTVPVAIALVVAAGLALAGIFHPQSLAALAED